MNRRTTIGSLIVVLLLLAVLVTTVDARKRGRSSFGGKRGGATKIWVAPKPTKPSLQQKLPRSFGGSRALPKEEQRRGSFGGTRSEVSSSPGRKEQTIPRATDRSDLRSSSEKGRRSLLGSQRRQAVRGEQRFWGQRLATGQSYRQRYGIPRRSENVSIRDGDRQTAIPARVHYYGGRADQFMMGYLLGTVPWYWSLPFHPAFYYTRPYVVEHSDGSLEVYPGTFSWARLFLMLAIFGMVGFWMWSIFRGKRRRVRQISSFSG